MPVIPASPIPFEVSESLAATTAELGLNTNFHELQESGYTVIEDAAPAEFFHQLRQTILDSGIRRHACRTR